VGKGCEDGIHWSQILLMQQQTLDIMAQFIVVSTRFGKIHCALGRSALACGVK
jgi:hypothetical protein